MKKSFATLFALGLSGGALADNLTAYGIVDLGVSRDSGGAAGNSLRVSSGMNSQSRWGFRGNEDLGQGVGADAAFELEEGADDGAAIRGNIFGRKALVGLSNPWGSVSLGLQDTPFYTILNTVVDPFRNGVARANNVMASTGTRAGNSVLMQSAAVQGVKGSLMYAAGEVDGDAAAGRVLGGALSYSAGGFNAGLAYHHKNNDTTTAKNTSGASNFLLGANYDFGVAKLYAGYGRGHGAGSAYFTPAAVFSAKAPAAPTDARDMLLGLSVPVYLGTLRFSYAAKDDRGPLNQDARQVGVGYFYPLSKNTELYTSVARIRNRNGAAYTAGNTTEAGKGNVQTTLGLTHRF